MIVQLSSFTLMIFAIHVITAHGQTCIWNPSTPSTFHGVTGKPTHFYYESLTHSWDGTLFTWRLEAATLAAYEYKSAPAPRFVVDEKPTARVISSSKYVSSTMSLHNLTITSLLASDDGKQVTLQREGCSWATEKAKPITLIVSCCDPDVFGKNAIVYDRGSTIKCNDKVFFICNETMYQATYFTTVCQADSTWEMMQHPCKPKQPVESKSNQLYLGIGFSIGLTIGFVIAMIGYAVAKRIEKSRNRFNQQYNPVNHLTPVLA